MSADPKPTANLAAGTDHAGPRPEPAPHDTVRLIPEFGRERDEARWQEREWPADLPLPAGRGYSREYTAAHQRRRILRAMAQTVDAGGWTGTSVRAVCRRAGVSSSAYYKQFENREECFLALYDSAAECLLERTAASWEPKAREGEAAAPQLLRRCLQTLLDAVAGEPLLARVCMAHATALGAVIAERHDAYLRRFAIPLSAAATAHNGAPPPQLWTEGLVGAIFELIETRVVRDEIDGLPDLLDDMYHFSVRMFEYTAIVDHVDRD